MKSNAHTTLLALLIVITTTIISLINTGFIFGYGNNVFHIPYVLRYNELPVFHYDAFYSSLDKFTSIIWPALRLVSNNENVELLFYGSHIASRLLAFIAIFIFFKANSTSSFSVAILSLSAAAICPWLTNCEVGVHGLFIGYFTHSEVTWGPLVAALVAAQFGRLRYAAAFAAIVFLINAFIGIWIAFVIAVTTMSNREHRKDTRLLIQSILIYLLTCLPVVLWIAFSLRHKTQFPDYSYIEYIRAYYPKHFLIESTSNYGLRNLGIIVYCGFVSACLGNHRKFWFSVLGAFVALLAIGAVLPYILNNRFVFSLHLLRSAGVLQFISIILALAASVEFALNTNMNRPGFRGGWLV